MRRNRCCLLHMSHAHAVCQSLSMPLYLTCCVTTCTSPLTLARHAGSSAGLAVHGAGCKCICSSNGRGFRHTASTGYSAAERALHLSVGNVQSSLRGAAAACWLAQMCISMPCSDMLVTLLCSLAWHPCCSRVMGYKAFTNTGNIIN